MLSKFSVKKPFTVFVAVVIVLVLGFVSYTEMTPDLLPNMDFPYVVIMTAYPGASPEKVEEAVTRPIEQAVSTVESFNSVSSTSADNYSMVMLELTEDANMDSAMLDIREKLDTASASWEDTIGEPSLLKINPNIMPVVVAAVDMQQSDIHELSDFLEDTLITKLEGVEGVAGVTASGVVESQVNVFLSKEKIDRVNQKLKKSVEENFDSGMKQLADAKVQLNATKADLTAKLKEMDSGLPTLKQTKTQLSELQETIRTLEETVVSLESTLSELEALRDTVAQLEGAMSTLPAGTPQYEQAAQALTQIDAQLSNMGMTRAQLPDKLEKAKSGYTQATQGIEQINAQLESMGTTRAQLPDKLKELDSAIAQMESGRPTAEAALEQVNTSLTELETKEADLKQLKADTADSADVSGKLTMDTVSQILTAQNFSMPAGYVSEDGVDYLIRVGDTFDSTETLQSLTLFDPGVDGIDPIHLSDVADVVVTDNSAQIYAKINGTDGVVLSFTKQSNAATADVSENLAKRFDELCEEYDGLEFTALMDQGDYIQLIVDSVISNLVWGAVLAIVILFIFLKDIRPTVLVALSIPVSVVFAIVLMYFSGVTLNLISLSGLAIGVGMLVDNSVVVIENIYRLRGKGVPAAKAAVAGATQVAGSIVSSTLTTICVFLPIVFVQGLTRQLFTDMALTIAYSLLASLIVALTLVPAVSSGLLRNMKPKKQPWFDKLLHGYEKAVRWSLAHRALVLVLVLVLLVSSVVLTVRRGFIFMPQMSSAEVSVTLQMPQDSELSDTIAASDAVVEQIEAIEGVETVGAMLGGESLSLMGGGESDTTSVTMYVLLREDAKLSSTEVAERINEMAQDKPYTLTAAGSMDMSAMMSSMGGSGVTVNVYGNDLDDLRETALAIADRLSAVEGIAEVNDGVGETTPELAITVDKDKAAERGLTVAQVYMQVAEAIKTETTATTLLSNDGDYKVIVTDSKAETLSLDTVRDLSISTTGMDGTTDQVKLSDVATLEEGETMASVSRIGQRRYLSVSATLQDGYNISLVTTQAKNALDDFTPPEGISMEFSGENETIMDAMWELTKMLLLAVLFVYVIMVAQFQSLLSPFIVMFTIPLAFTGGLLGLLLTGNEISVNSMIGFVMLAGIIVNNGIVLVDYINQLRKEGADKREAIVEAGVTRMRPILMTTLTTVIALGVSAFAGGMGAEMMQPISIVCVGGLLYATLMTLFVVPVMYDLLNRKKELRNIRDEELVYDEEAQDAAEQ